MRAHFAGDDRGNGRPEDEITSFPAQLLMAVETCGILATTALLVAMGVRGLVV
jgi:hypothetical protein